MLRLYLPLAAAMLSMIQCDCSASGQIKMPLSNVDAKNPSLEYGPTVVLSCQTEENTKNPLADFMYFVPLISPVSVSSQENAENRQVGYLISCERQTNAHSFHTVCRFRMEGDGFHTNEFDREETIERNKKSVKPGEPLKNILDYIKFQGEGYGRIQIEGTIEGDRKTVTKVAVHFNDGGTSPVTVGLYSVKPANNQYKYQNSYSSKVARINTLTFTRSDTDPEMAIELAAVGKDEESLGFWARVTGRLANLFIDPIGIDPLGNEQMLKLGLALYNNEPTFTFPKARNLKPSDHPRDFE